MHAVYEAADHEAVAIRNMQGADTAAIGDAAWQYAPNAKRNEADTVAIGDAAWQYAPYAKREEGNTVATGDAAWRYAPYAKRSEGADAREDAAWGYGS